MERLLLSDTMDGNWLGKDGKMDGNWLGKGPLAGVRHIATTAAAAAACTSHIISPHNVIVHKLLLAPHI